MSFRSAWRSSTKRSAMPPDDSDLGQYARPKISRFPYAEGRLHRMHRPSSAGPSDGMQRGVAEVAALISSSHSGVPQWNASAQPVLTASTNSSQESTTAV